MKIWSTVKKVNQSKGGIIRPPPGRKILQGIQKLSSFILSLLPCISLWESKLISQELGPRAMFSTYTIWQLSGNQWSVVEETSHWCEVVWDSLIPLQVSTLPLGSASDFEPLHFLFKTSLSDGNTVLFKRKGLSFLHWHHETGSLSPRVHRPWCHSFR